MFERFMEKLSKSLCPRRGKETWAYSVGTEQILLGLIGEGTGVAKVLKSLGVNLKDSRIEVEKLLEEDQVLLLLKYRLP